MKYFFAFIAEMHCMLGLAMLVSRTIFATPRQKFALWKGFAVTGLVLLTAIAFAVTGLFLMLLTKAGE